MKNTTATLMITLFLLGCVFSFQEAFAASKSEQSLGEAETCLDVYRIKETRIIDNQTILFIMRGGKRYLNRLPVPCAGLVVADGFGYSTSITKLCMQDHISVLSPGSAPGNICMLGKFIPIESDMKDSALVKLLEDGLLEALVAEGAFEEAFSDN